MELTFEDVLKESLNWCETHPGWKRICDIEDTDSLYKTWDELSDKEKRPWIKEYKSGAEECWGEYGKNPCKVIYGFVTGKGEFYENISLAISHGDFMQVYKIS